MCYHTSERAQGLVEYALIILLVALIVIVVLSILGPAIGNIFSELIPQI
jgi:pilus assembly protein Flp/PilA